jgi:hypothetical protein
VRERPSTAELAGEALVEALRPLVADLVAEELDRREAERRLEWLTVEEYAELQRTTPAAVHKRLERGQVPGAAREGRRWLIPASSASPSARFVGSDNEGSRGQSRRARGTRRS